MYKEVKNIDIRIRENLHKLDIHSLKKLTRPSLTTNMLQRFVNTAVEYVEILNAQQQDNANKTDTSSHTLVLKRKSTP